ncbi:RAMP superfamily CRISPR-associated protein [Calorimonas adulescens]|uniref:CRISPR type III-associated protein domain-containing protein n=1 Tax=Calorimonas adulescens TaxID=2606906 RepID=A0A5D8QCP3_9THEO|nr:RAMP superfamily CRISPR-associated protein [Calorimonas adulescens]TZE82167.1 hypothetical protein FWJ32_06665 [Calorimonas adulescens]
MSEYLAVKGQLIFEEPFHTGGDISYADWSDNPVLVDPIDGSATILGSSIAGAMRDYLVSYATNYHSKGDCPIADEIFGYVDDENKNQSRILVYDLHGYSYTPTIRDGVMIDPETGTALRDMKYDAEFINSGACFDIAFDVFLDNEEEKRAIATIMKGFENGEISLGYKKNRGYGRCRVTNWEIKLMDLSTPSGLCEWLLYNRGESDEWKNGKSSEELMGIKAFYDKRDIFRLSCEFGVDGSLLIGTNYPNADIGVDKYTVVSADSGKAVIPGTSLAGVLRERAVRIFNTYGADLLGVYELFGCKDKASRIVVHESTVENQMKPIVINRVKIDRFTGGALETALFDEMPIYGSSDTRVNVNIEIRQPKDHEIGLILFLIRDLWVGDLTVGGESGIGRGRLKGMSGKISRKDELINIDEGFNFSEQQKIDKYVDAFLKCLGVKSNE